MEIESVIAVIRKGAKRLAPLLFEKKHVYNNGEKFVGLYIEEEYCCFVIAQAKLHPNPMHIEVLAGFKDILLLDKINFDENQGINNKEVIDADNLYYLTEFRSMTTYYHTKELIFGILQKTNCIQFLNTRTDEPIFIRQGINIDVVDVQITKTEFDTLMLTLNTHALIDLKDDYILLKNINYESLINILSVRRNDVIIEDGLQYSEQS